MRKTGPKISSLLGKIQRRGLKIKRPVPGWMVTIGSGSILTAIIPQSFSSHLQTTDKMKDSALT